jgi:hypothetical protein
MSVKTLYPTTQPSLLLDFANVKQLDPRVTFVRTTTATYYDGVTTAKAEENLLLHSQEFENAAWNKTNTTITANNATAPDGTSTAETVTATAGTNIDAIVARFNLSSTAGLDYVISFFAKAGTYSAFQITNGNFQASSAHANFDLSDGTVGTSANCTASIQNAGNSWYRCIVVFAATATVTSGAVYACLAASTSASRFQKWSPVGTETIELWGAQLEQRSAVTAYTPTTTQPITNYIPVLLTAPAGVARSDHNPTTGESLGLLVEEQRTNLVLRSEEFDNAAWTKTNSSITSNIIVAPDGTLTGDKLVENTATSAHLARQSPTGTVTAVHTFSCYAKAAERSVIALQLVDDTSTGNGIASYFNLLTGATSNISNFGNGSGAVATMTAVGNGWYRCTLSGITNTSGTTFRAIVFVVQTAGSTTYTGDGYSGIYIWGAQLEAGAFPTSYIPTVAATVTRNADEASMTGTNFSSWYRADEGTLYSEAIFTNTVSFNTVAALGDGTTNNIIRTIQWNDGTDRIFAVTTNNTTQASFIGTGQVGASKFAGAYKFNDVNASKNGSIGTTDTSAVIPAVNALYIGQSGPALFLLNGHIRKLAYYPKRLTNAELQGLTS